MYILLLTHNQAAGDFQWLHWCLSQIPTFSLMELKFYVRNSYFIRSSVQEAAVCRFILRLYIIIVSSADHFNKSQFVPLVFLYWNIDKAEGPCVTSAALVNFTITHSLALLCLPFLWVIHHFLNVLFLCQPDAKCYVISFDNLQLRIN